MKNIFINSTQIYIEIWFISEVWFISSFFFSHMNLSIEEMCVLLTLAVHISYLDIVYCAVLFIPKSRCVRSDFLVNPQRGSRINHVSVTRKLSNYIVALQKPTASNVQRRVQSSLSSPLLILYCVRFETRFLI